MKKSNRKDIKIWPDDKYTLDQLRREVALIEGSNVSEPEFMRRISKIEILPDRLKNDARLKFGLRRKYK